MSFLRDELKLPAPKYGTLSQNLATKYFLLPSSENEPVPAPELSRYLEIEPPPNGNPGKLIAIICKAT
ncbi:MAG: hypothetical protein WBA77_16195 [Microcoleaceae cyanobacterium]